MAERCVYADELVPDEVYYAFGIGPVPGTEKRRTLVTTWIFLGEKNGEYLFEDLVSRQRRVWFAGNQNVVKQASEVDANGRVYLPALVKRSDLSSAVEEHMDLDG